MRIILYFLITFEVKNQDKKQKQPVSHQLRKFIRPDFGFSYGEAVGV